ncbi:MAG TPA: ABC transporter ATP-binding protein [Mycobacteriales bacterium]|nr:ABC transporter ATP-binding protein [Mycobacteriales bacterium]
MSTTAAAAPLVRTAPAVELVDVCSGYGATQVLRGVSLTVPESSITALLGPNGAGKSTLLKTVSGLIRPTRGAVRVRDADVTRWSANRRARRGLCHIPEGRAIFRNLTVRENLVMQANGGSEADAIEKASTAFPVLGKRLGQSAGTLSGGEQQMLALMRAYLHNDQVVLVDEPSLGLAPIIVDVIFEFLHTITQQGSALLLVDQFATRALAMASAVYVLNRGEVVFQGKAGELERSELFQRYLGDG